MSAFLDSGLPCCLYNGGVNSYLLDRVTNMKDCNQLSIGSSNTLSSHERSYLKQNANQFIEKLKAQSIIKFDTTVHVTKSSFYIEFSSKIGRKMSIRLSNHGPCAKQDSKEKQSEVGALGLEQEEVLEQSGSPKQGETLGQNEVLALGENLKQDQILMLDESSEQSEKTVSSDSSVGENKKPVFPDVREDSFSTLLPPIAGRKTHPFPTDHRKRRGERILWSWSYDSFDTWESFEKTATKVARNWIASECIGGRMHTWSKDRF